MGLIDRFTPSDPLARSLFGLFFASVPQAVFLFALVVGINLSEYNEVLQGASMLTISTLFVGFLLSSHVAHVLFRDVADRADAAAGADTAFPRLAGAGIAAAIGVPTLVYGIFVALLDWPVQMSLYAGRIPGFGVLLVGLASLYYAQRTVRDVSKQAAEADQMAASDDETADQEADDPVETLKHRYATGELSESEFEAKLERLVGTDETVSTTERDGEFTEPDFESDLGDSLAETE